MLTKNNTKRSLRPPEKLTNTDMFSKESLEEKWKIVIVHVILLATNN